MISHMSFSSFLFIHLGVVKSISSSFSSLFLFVLFCHMFVFSFESFFFSCVKFSRSLASSLGIGRTDLFENSILSIETETKSTSVKAYVRLILEIPISCF